MAIGLLIGSDQEVSTWCFATFRLFPMRVDRALGIMNDDRLVGAILLQNYNGSNIELSYYGPRTLTLGLARSIAKIVIAEFDAARATVITSKKNKRLTRALSKFGFKLEGIQRCYYGPSDCNRNTGVRFVLFRDGIEKIAKYDGSDRSKKSN
jgi:RimJ/RimL family protein N-acetyltransferase